MTAHSVSILQWESADSAGGTAPDDEASGCELDSGVFDSPGIRSVIGERSLMIFLASRRKATGSARRAASSFDGPSSIIRGPLCEHLSVFSGIVAAIRLTSSSVISFMVFLFGLGCVLSAEWSQSSQMVLSRGIAALRVWPIRKDRQFASSQNIASSSVISFDSSISFQLLDSQID